jgi:hypothetical protein
MNTRRLLGFSPPVLQGVLTLLAVSALHADTTFTYRNGANAYTSAAVRQNRHLRFVAGSVPCVPLPLEPRGSGRIVRARVDST